jgi:hypothetical protein
VTAVQLALPVERPAGTPPLTIRAEARGLCVLRAECDWTREGAGWRSSNGWTVRPQTFGDEIAMRHGWAAYAPDGYPEWWAEDPVTAMVRAEGGS